MPGGRAVTVATAALLLEVLPLVVAHGHGDGSDESSVDTINDESRSYWILTEHVGLMYMHIALEG
jgi:hypothetical protein